MCPEKSLRCGFGVYSLRVVLGVVLCALFVSCGTAGADGWYRDFDVAKKRARRQHKNMVLCFSRAANGDAVFAQKEFVEKVQGSFVLVQLDVSDAALQSESHREKVSQLVSLYNVCDMHSAFLLTEDGYFLSELVHDSAYDSPDAYARMLEEKLVHCNEQVARIARLKKSRGFEKVRVLDELLEKMPAEQCWCFIDVMRAVPSLDKKNKTGLVEKYVLKVAEYDALLAFSRCDVRGAMRAFVAVAESGKLSSEYAQRAYYLAGSMLGFGGSTEYDEMVRYFKSAYDAAPESAEAKAILKMTTRIESLIAESRAEKNTNTIDAK